MIIEEWKKRRYQAIKKKRLNENRNYEEHEQGISAKLVTSLKKRLH